MAQKSGIDTLDSLLPTIVGCTPDFQCFERCWARKMAARLQGNEIEMYLPGFGQITLHPEKRADAYHWKEPSLIGLNFMSDEFHSDVPVEHIIGDFKMAEECSWHVFKVLTKRSPRLAALAPSLSWPSNLWIGVSVECEDYLRRLDDLRTVPTPNRFVYFEPLIGPIRNPNLEGIPWIVVGGESGPGCRPLNPDWVRHLRDYCAERGVIFTFKQWGGNSRRSGGRILDGREWFDFPPEIKRVFQKLRQNGN